eukprot:561868-Rhodomonas_salina.2
MLPVINAYPDIRMLLQQSAPITVQKQPNRNENPKIPQWFNLDLLFADLDFPPAPRFIPSSESPPNLLALLVVSSNATSGPGRTPLIPSESLSARGGELFKNRD